ncbi:MAG: PfkB family carbohydrate kinase [Pseudomonadota bacterium]
MNAPARPILCIGAAHWDIIAHAHEALHPGADVAGHVEQRPGGVALNIASALASRSVRPILLSVVGEDAPGRALIAAAEARGVNCQFITELPHATDSYIAIETAQGELFAATADCALLEAAGAAFLEPLRDGRLSSFGNPFPGMVIVDGNLGAMAIQELAESDLLAEADIRLAPASPSKARRLLPLLAGGRVTVYANVAEAEALAGTPLPHADAAATALRELGARAALVTDGPRPAAYCRGDRTIFALPPPVRARTATGAGDVLVAAHITAETTAATDWDALRRALRVAAWHVAGPRG